MPEAGLALVWRGGQGTTTGGSQPATPCGGGILSRSEVKHRQHQAIANSNTISNFNMFSLLMTSANSGAKLPALAPKIAPRFPSDHLLIGLALTDQSKADHSSGSSRKASFRQIEITGA